MVALRFFIIFVKAANQIEFIFKNPLRSLKILFGFPRQFFQCLLIRSKRLKFSSRVSTDSNFLIVLVFVLYDLSNVFHCHMKINPIK